MPTFVQKQASSILQCFCPLQTRNYHLLFVKLFFFVQESCTQPSTEAGPGWGGQKGTWRWDMWWDEQLLFYLSAGSESCLASQALRSFSRGPWPSSFWSRAWGMGGANGDRRRTFLLYSLFPYIAPEVKNETVEISEDCWFLSARKKG